jgi:DNA-binding transcriptional ArsR family regulator
MKEHQEISDPSVVKALAHPLRIQILGVLENETASPNELSERLGAPLGNVAYHTRELLRFGFVELVKKTPRRGAIEHYYRATTRPRVNAAGWAATPDVVKGAMVRSALEQISTFVNAAAVEGGFNREEAHLNRVQLTLDDKGWQELSTELARILKVLPKIEEASKKRLARAGHEGEQKATVVTMAFDAAEPMVARAKSPKSGARRKTPKQSRA